jgi:hypothetical protein
VKQNVVTEPAGGPGTRDDVTRTLSLFCDISVLMFCYHKGYNIPVETTFKAVSVWRGEGLDPRSNYLQQGFPVSGPQDSL